MARVGTGIAQEIRRHRLAAGMSAQQLSDACAALGADIPRTVISNIENGRRTNVSVAEVLVFARALGQPPAALVFPAGYVSEVEYLPSKTSDPLEAEDWWSGQNLAPDQRMKALYAWPPSDPTREWAMNIARKHREVVSRIRTLYRSAFESEVLERTAHEPDNESETARAVAKQLEYHLYDIRDEMARRGLIVPELPAGMTINKRPEEHVTHGDEGEIVGRWTQHGPPPF
ncbi:helix-turn-helix transcriptional regulator [Streptomyces canus]|uniref:helix-turn-helix domain-containing protein n=1 Tax=Streptomyces canus TaxID=58343 RepID=UPI002E324210|nr:helix-turn-helix transcriptional regulator [Streptomyces canus]